MDTPDTAEKKRPRGRPRGPNYKTPSPLKGKKGTPGVFRAGTYKRTKLNFSIDPTLLGWANTTLPPGTRAVFFEKAIATALIQRAIEGGLEIPQEFRDHAPDYLKELVPAKGPRL